MALEVAVATLVFALAVSVHDNFAALIYAVVAIQVPTLRNWMVLTVAFLVYYIYRAVGRAVRG
jgi:hypothetical protein